MQIRITMIDTKKLYQYLNIMASLSLALTIPYLIFRVFKAVCLKYGYSALMGKVVVITGASSGLGEALAHEFYKQGCQVVLCARRRQELERVRSDLLQLHPTVPTIPPIINPLDLTDINVLPAHIAKILSITGRIDILINNGGISHRSSILNTKPDVDIKIMMVNYFGAVALTKAVLPNMVKKQSGHVVFISSVQGLMALPERSAYGASKHALQAFADSLRAEMAANNILVTVVSPGYVKTQLSHNALTGSGGVYGEMDPSTESGYSAEYTAKKIAKAVVQKREEVVIAPILPKVAIVLRHSLPSWYFYIMAKRAKKNLTFVKKD